MGALCLAAACLMRSDRRSAEDALLWYSVTHEGFPRDTQYNKSGSPGCQVFATVRFRVLRALNTQTLHLIPSNYKMLHVSTSARPVLDTGTRFRHGKRALGE